VRIYISGPITGIDNYRQNFDKAEETLIALGCDVINPARVDDCIKNLTYDEFLALDLFMLEMCDAIYLLPGWMDSKGAKAEVARALAKNKLIYSEMENNIIEV